MSNVEIYDSSNSQLSSDEYSHDEDDDALMDVAVSKQQQQQQTPSKSMKSNTTSTSTDTSPSKSTSSATTPSKTSSTDLDAAAGSTNKPPDSRERTQRQIKQMQRDNKANLYFKRRSIIWLNQRLTKNRDYLNQMRDVLPRHQEHARRMAEYRAKKRAYEMDHHRRYERTPSRSRTRTRSHSPSHSESLELICLDDTENEDSPEKPTRQTPPTEQLIQQVASKTPPPFSMQLELEAEAMPAENGSVLDEFLTLKPAVAAEPIIEEAAVCNDLKEQPQEQLDLTVLSSYNHKVVQEIEIPLEETTLKRRRSVTPPPTELTIDKRTKTMPIQDSDDDIIELIPSDMSMTAKQLSASAPPPPQPQQPQQKPPPPPETPTEKATIMDNPLVASIINAAAANVPILKLGSPYSLAASTVLEYYNPEKEQQPKQMQPENLAPISYSLETPTPPVEPMEIVYPNEKLPNINKTSVSVVETVSAPAVIQQQAVMEPQQQQLLQAPQEQQPQQQQLLQTPQQQSPPKQRSESTSRQTQTVPPGRNKSSVDLNNSNSDAVFHQRVKEMYVELDEIMTDKVRAVKPELKAFAEEKQHIDSDIKTLDKLIGQKEEEYNRLLHLRCIKMELRARIERKERILIMKEILPSILNKNCNTSEIYEMHSLLMQEQNAPMPSRHGLTAMEQLINRVENGLDDIKILRSALGMQEKETLAIPRPPPHFEGQQHRRNSVPSMRPPPPPVAADRSAVYGRQGAVRDVRGLIEDFRREHPEEQPLVGKRNKLQPPSSSRFQQLINESKQLTNSSMNLAAASSYRNQSEIHRSQPNLLNNHFDNEMPIKPLYNSSPLGAANPRNQSRANSHYNNDMHSMYSSDQVQELESTGRAANRINNNNRSKHIGATTNGPEDLERRCQQCQRFKATYMCAGCKNQWYCSKECQLHAWDTHWETCCD
ncbi:hypothetical protein ACLKA6_011489 [Drosophila palustris]